MHVFVLSSEFTSGFFNVCGECNFHHLLSGCLCAFFSLGSGWFELIEQEKNKNRHNRKIAVNSISLFYFVGSRQWTPISSNRIYCIYFFQLIPIQIVLVCEFCCSEDHSTFFFSLVSTNDVFLCLCGIWTVIKWNHKYRFCIIFFFECHWLFASLF